MGDGRRIGLALLTGGQSEFYRLPSTIDEASGAKAAREKLKEESGRQLAELQRLENEQRTRMANEESAANEARVQREARARQRAKSASATGQRSTILTSPLGSTGSAQTTRKTVLGV